MGGRVHCAGRGRPYSWEKNALKLGGGYTLLAGAAPIVGRKPP